MATPAPRREDRDRRDRGRDDRDRDDGQDDFRCPMTQRRIYLEKSCRMCKKPYVQDEQNQSTCVFMGKRSFGKDTYVGRMSNYKQEGKGHYSWGGTKNEYYGLWFNGMRHGKGIKKFDDGALYMGEWTRNKMNGFGTYTFASGRNY